MSKTMIMNAFMINRPVHQSPGLWRHPGDRSTLYTDINYWTSLARLLEEGLFDAVFFADGLGANDVYGGSLDAALQHGSHAPSNDPFSLIPAMAAVTEHLGFAVTGNLSFEPPYLFARRMSTLDHLTKGRLGWNVVTGSSDAGARGMGRTGIAAHDTRYDIADEFMDVVYKLWEASWEDGSALWDRDSGIVSDPAKVHKIVHDGAHFKVDSIHLCEPSPQRTPVLFQAGASPRGRDFAGRHAEGVFIIPPSKAAARQVVADINARASAARGEEQRLLYLPMVTTIVGETEAEARAKHEEFKTYADLEGALVIFSAWTGIDVSRHDLDEPFKPELRSAGAQSLAQHFSEEVAGRPWTLREIAQQISIGGMGPVIVGSPEQVADELESWVEEAGVDGFNLAYATSPGTYVDFIRYVVPELQRRGVYKTRYETGTLREKLGGGSAHLPDRHPARLTRGAR